VYVKKERLLKFVEKCIKATPPALALDAKPESEDIPHVEPALIREPVKIQEPAPELPKERLCPSCSRKAARQDSKYCDFCGEEL
jgi:hypothetical protein